LGYAIFKNKINGGFCVNMSISKIQFLSSWGCCVALIQLVISLNLILAERNGCKPFPTVGLLEKIAKWVKGGCLMMIRIYAKVSNNSDT